MKLSKQLTSLMNSGRFNAEIVKRFGLRMQEDRLTRDENPESHFCVYFAAFDPARKEVFIGHHKKSGLWLFSGGHIDQGETIEETVSREIWEEWGQKIASANIPQPSLLTTTNVLTPNITCKIHFDIWHFFPVEKKRFLVDQSKIFEEFHQIGWFPVSKVVEKVTDPSTITALHRVTRSMF